MEPKRQIIDGHEWQFLLGKANTAYLGKIKSRWKVINNNADSISITLYKEKLLRSIACSAFLSFFITLNICIKGVDYTLFWLYSIPVIWLFIGLRFGYRREVFWKKNTDEILFIFGFYPFTKQLAISRNNIYAKLKKEEVAIYMYNIEYPNTHMKLISSVRQIRIIPVVDALKEILGDNFEEETEASLLG